MKLDIVKISNSVVDNCNSVGNFAINKCKKLGTNFNKGFDSFVSNTKFDSLKGKVGGKTLLGAGIIAAVAALAIKTIKSVRNEINRIKEK